MSAVPASTVSLKTMADGTLRISFDVEPSQAQAAFKLFAAPGTQVAIAALKDGSFLAQPAPNPEAYPDLPQPRVQLGDACYRTVLWCNEPSFWKFLSSEYVGLSKTDVSNASEASYLVKVICAVTSRKDLDTNDSANKSWHRLIRLPYADYLKRMEAA